jgi:hypothetical protein
MVHGKAWVVCPYALRHPCVDSLVPILPLQAHYSCKCSILLRPFTMSPPRASMNDLDRCDGANLAGIRMDLIVIHYHIDPFVVRGRISFVQALQQLLEQFIGCAWSQRAVRCSPWRRTRSLATSRRRMNCIRRSTVPGVPPRLALKPAATRSSAVNAWSPCARYSRTRYGTLWDCRSTVCTSNTYN